jgi:hypothetical protein
MQSAILIVALMLVEILTPVPGPAPDQVRGRLGTIEGRVTFEGIPPTPAIVEGGSQPVLYVSPQGGLRYAVVVLPATRQGGTLPATVATMNQHQFIFEPQVLAVRAGQSVRFTNSDPANHNVRARDPNPANTFSVNTVSGATGPATHRAHAAPGWGPWAIRAPSA